MNFKTRNDLPSPLVKALIHDSYKSSVEDYIQDLPSEIREKFTHTISVTTLPRSPRQRLLFIRHSKEMTADPVDKMWSIFGRVGHSIFEEYAEKGDEVEKRRGIIFPVKIGKELIHVWLHGCADHYSPEKEEILDWKFTKCGAMAYDKSDHHIQLNILGYIWRKCGRKVKSLKNLYVFRDWNQNFVSEDGDGDYPKEPVMVKEAPLWTDEQCQSYLTERLTKHYSNEGKPDDDLDFCSDEELWRSSPLYRVYKLDDNGEQQKMAKFTSEVEADALAAKKALEEADKQKVLDKNNALKKPKPEDTLTFAKYTMVTQPSEPRKCPHCECRSWCSQRLAQLVAEHESQNAAVA